MNTLYLLRNLNTLSIFFYSYLDITHLLNDESSKGSITTINDLQEIKCSNQNYELLLTLYISINSARLTAIHWFLTKVSSSLIRKNDCYSFKRNFCQNILISFERNLLQQSEEIFYTTFVTTWGYVYVNYLQQFKYVWINFLQVKARFTFSPTDYFNKMIHSLVGLKLMSKFKSVNHKKSKI